MLPTTIKSLIGDSHMQLRHGNGYDHCWIFNHPACGINKVATLMDIISGRVMELFADKPGLHIYTGNFLRGTFHPYSGVCLETSIFQIHPISQISAQQFCARKNNIQVVLFLSFRSSSNSNKKFRSL